MTVTDDRVAFDAAINSLRSIESTQSLAVGIFNDFVAPYALAHEVEIGWFRAAIDAEPYLVELEALVDAAIAGQDIEPAIKAIGVRVVVALKEAIEGAGLVDTGTMRDSVEAQRGVDE